VVISTIGSSPRPSRNVTRAGAGFFEVVAMAVSGQRVLEFLGTYHTCPNMLNRFTNFLQIFCRSLTLHFSAMAFFAMKAVAGRYFSARNRGGLVQSNGS